MTDFAKKLDRERESLGMTQDALADYLGYEQPTISRWLSGKHTPHESVQTTVFKKLAEYRGSQEKIVTGVTAEQVSEYLEKRLNEKIAEVISLGVVPVYVLEKLKTRYHRSDDKEKRKIEFLLEEMLGQDYEVMLRWIKDIQRDDSA